MKQRVTRIPSIKINTVIPEYRWFIAGLLVMFSASGWADLSYNYVAQPGHKSLNEWLLPAKPESPEDNKWNEARAELGKQLFFDPRLSGTGQVTCASCHLPERGWSDGQPTAVRFMGKVMKLASPVLTNIAYNKVFMWDGRKSTLEDQAFGGQGQKADINAGSTVGPDVVISRLNKVKGYVDAFNKLYPGEGLTRKTVAKAVASFERTIVSNDSPFDRWVKGDKKALSAEQVNGFKLFVDTKKAGCIECHIPPNFTDNGFHNIGLKSYGEKDHHPGRFKHRPLKSLDGAFKTPTLRDVAMSAPYFHDGSANTLEEVVEHYVKGGEVKTNLSGSFVKAKLSAKEKKDLVSFLKALTTVQKPFIYPVLPE